MNVFSLHLNVDAFNSLHLMTGSKKMPGASLLALCNWSQNETFYSLRCCKASLFSSLFLD